MNVSLRTLCNVIYICVILTFYQVISNDITEIKYDTSAAEKLFKRLYTMERTEQLAAVHALLKLDEPGQKRKMFEAIAANVLYVIEGSKLILDDENFIPGETTFPSDERVRDALANVLENTAFLADIIVRVPFMSQKVLNEKPEWISLFQWSINFTNNSKLIDTNTTQLLTMVSQEMNFLERGLDFVNPLNTEVTKPKPVEQIVKKTKKRKSLPRGPKLSSRQIGEL